MDEKKKKELAIRSSAAEYLTFVASTGESDASPCIAVLRLVTSVLRENSLNENG